MLYMLLIATEEAEMVGAPPEAEAEMLEAYGKFGAEMEARGVLRGGGRLRPTTDATTVRVRDGQTLTADGPFAETKEQLGGYFMVEVDNLDEAIEIAAKIPGALIGSIEVRPVWPM